MGWATRGWIDFAASSGLPILDEARLVAKQFAPEIARYCELIRGPADSLVGIMTWGEGESFTARTQSWLRAWHMSADALAEHASSAERFAHKRSFLKLEWWSSPGGPVERLAAYYFRRRPAVQTVVQNLGERGVAQTVLERITQAAAILEKETIHFVAGAMRPATTMHHKLYFSQHVTPESEGRVASRLGRLTDLFEIDGRAVAELRRRWAVLVPPARNATVFVSMKFDRTAVFPGFKVDLPQVPAALLSDWAPLGSHARADVESLCAAARRDELSYLGVTLRSLSTPLFKYYADLPDDLAVHGLRPAVRPGSGDPDIDMSHHLGHVVKF